MRDLPQPAWYRSSFCTNGSCVEVALLGDQVAMRDSKDKDGPTLAFTQTEWAAFLSGVKNDEFLIPHYP